MRVLFTRDFDWPVPERRGRVVVAFKEGMVLVVRRCCGELALALGVAREPTDEEWTRAHPRAA